MAKNRSRWSEEELSQANAVRQEFLRIETLGEALQKELSALHNRTGGDMESIRLKYSELKRSLDEKSKLGSTRRSAASLNHFESAFLVPACAEARARLTAATNSNPLNSDWHSQIYSALFDVRHLRQQLPGGEDSQD